MVEAVGGAVTDLAPGDHVVLSFRACGGSKNCVRVLPSRCANLFDSNFSGAKADGSCALSREGGAIQGRFPIEKLITFYPLEDIEQAVQDSESGRVVKAMLRPGATA